MSRLLILLTCVLFFSFTRIKEESSTKKPNILIIMADDCTYSDLPLYGGVNVKTPQIDKLAAQGMTFNKAYVTISIS